MRSSTVDTAVVIGAVDRATCMWLAFLSVKQMHTFACVRVRVRKRLQTLLLRVCSLVACLVSNVLLSSWLHACACVCVRACVCACAPLVSAVVTVH